MSSRACKRDQDTPQPAPFNTALLRGLDLSAWTPIASRSRKPPSTDSKPATHDWQLVEAAPLSIRQTQAAREAGVLLTALRYEPEVETLMVKLSTAAAKG